MRLLKSPSPVRAAGDLRAFLARRRPIELLMLFPALILTAVIVYMLFLEYKVEKPYQRNIIYVESWPLNRTDADIRAAQLTDQRNKKLALVQPKVEKNQRMLQFRRIDNWLTRHGI